MTKPLTTAQRQANFAGAMDHFFTTGWPGAAQRRAELVEAEAQAQADDAGKSWNALDTAAKDALRVQAKALGPRRKGASVS